MSAIRISLTDIPDNLKPGEPIACTINDNEHRAEFVVNRGGKWDRTAGMSANVEKGER